MMHLLFITSLLAVVSALPHSYQHVQFVPRTTDKLPRVRSGLTRNSRSYAYDLVNFPGSQDLWSFGGFPPQPPILEFGHERLGHFTPDYSNGLEYPDPYLLTGRAALAAVKYIYGRGELFFHNYPHVRALLGNQEERRENGLAGNKLSSARINSPFFRQ